MSNRILLHWDSRYCTGPVRMVPAFIDDKDTVPLTVRLKDCASHQTGIEGFTGDIGQTLVCTQSHPRYLRPTTFVFFGVGKPQEFSVETWRTGLTKALQVVRGYNIPHLVLDFDLIGFDGGRNVHAPVDPREIGQATSEAVVETVFNYERCVIELVQVAARWLGQDAHDALSNGLQAA